LSAASKKTARERIPTASALAGHGATGKPMLSKCNNPVNKGLF
jgi:hypothetical protein